MVPTPDMIAAAWAAWRVRHPHTRLGEGPAFREAVAAALAAAPMPLLVEALQAQGAVTSPGGGIVYLPPDQGRGVPLPHREPI